MMLFLAKFNSSGKLSWSTFYGGSGNDGANGVSTDPAGNVYMTGFTNSSKGIATSDAYQKSFKGTNGVAFLAKFSSSGSLTWATYYGEGDGNGGNGLKRGCFRKCIYYRRDN